MTLFAAKSQILLGHKTLHFNYYLYLSITEFINFYHEGRVEHRHGEYKPG